MRQSYKCTDDETGEKQNVKQYWARSLLMGSLVRTDLIFAYKSITDVWSRLALNALLLLLS